MPKTNLEWLGRSLPGNVGPNLILLWESYLEEEWSVDLCLYKAPLYCHTKYLHRDGAAWMLSVLTAWRR